MSLAPDSHRMNSYRLTVLNPNIKNVLIPQQKQDTNQRFQAVRPTGNKSHSIAAEHILCASGSTWTTVWG